MTSPDSLLPPADLAESAEKGESLLRAGIHRFRDNKLASAATIIVGLIIFIAFAAPLLPNYNPNSLSENTFAPPSLTHWMGTDDHGRDLWSRILFGTRISLLVGMIGATVSFFIGTAWGIIAGYFGGNTDRIMMRLVDILYSLPSIIFVIVLLTTMKDILLSGFLGQLFEDNIGMAHFVLLFVGLGAVSWLTLARIVRGQVISLKNQPFLESCHSLGLPPAYIITRHIFPNLFGIIITYVMLTVPSVILYESFLSFLGLGIESPMASLGSLIARGVPQINPVRIYWWLIAFPTVSLALLLICLNLMGQGLRDAFDPKSSPNR